MENRLTLSLKYDKKNNMKKIGAGKVCKVEGDPLDGGFFLIE
jgi:hypothetical protein